MKLKFGPRTTKNPHIGPTKLQDSAPRCYQKGCRLFVEKQYHGLFVSVFLCESRTKGPIHFDVTAYFLESMKTKRRLRAALSIPLVGFLDWKYEIV